MNAQMESALQQSSHPKKLHLPELPPLFLAAALLLWGYTCDLLIWSALMAVLIELARPMRFRFDFSLQDFARVSDLTTVVVLILVVYQFDERRVYAIYAILSALPIAFFPLLVAQNYSTAGSISVASLFFSVRRALRKGQIAEPPSIDVRTPYALLCLLCATVGENRGHWMLLVLFAALGWLLWSNRPRGFGAVRALFSLICTALLAFVFVFGGIWLRERLEPVALHFVEEYLQDYRDPYRTHTALGYLGNLKGSSRIMLRVTGVEQGRVPLLAEAVYRTFSNNVWIGSVNEFTPLNPDSEGLRWQLQAPRTPVKALGVSRYLPRGRALLALPAGAFAVDDLPVESVLRNELGTTRIDQGPNLVSYQVLYSPAGGRMPPSDRDLELPRSERATLIAIVEELGLEGLSDAERVARIRGYFKAGFSYSLSSRDRVHQGPPIVDFLNRTRSGHCEYFASATVLLLRAAGIPARYVTGYSVHEFSKLEGAYVARNRDAHAWASALVDGNWIDVDTTPAQWTIVETRNLPWWLSVRDLLAWLRHAWTEWRMSASDADQRRNWLLGLAALLAVLLVWRLRKSRWVRRQPGTEAGMIPRQQGADSELYRLERVLAKDFEPRQAHETVGQWLERLRNEVPPKWSDTAALDEILKLHYRYRFAGPLGRAERERLAGLVSSWLKSYRRGNKNETASGSP